LDKSEPDRLAFDYIKSNFFRVAHVDGAVGSATPSGLIHLACYSERPAIPRRMVFEVSAEGVLGQEVASLKDTRDSIVRELEIDLLMSVEVASGLRDWLTTQLEHVEEMKKTMGRK
jgi:hypothetical protein